MDPQIRYVKTDDGVNIAYYEMGAGPPFVYMHMPQSHLTAEWERDGRMFTIIASRARLIRLDPRGVGLSDRDPTEISLEAHIRDLKTVLDRLELPRVILHAAALSTAVGIAFAARYPERVSHLILVGPAVRAPAGQVDRTTHIFEAAGGDWRFASESLTRLAFTSGWDEPDS
jgi:pimeloyl-ACP methyl ester carboxylesterase